MRLMHAGLDAYVIGDAATPAARAGDRIVFISGSGRTGTLLALTERAEAVGCPWLAVTYTPDAPLAAKAACVLSPAVPRDASRPGGVGGSQWLGNLFDQAGLILLDHLAVAVALRRGASEADAQRRHANLE